MNVNVYTAIEDLSQLRSAWDALLANTPCASFFQSLAWLEVYWKHFSQDQQLRVLEICDAGETIGIVPLVVRRERSRMGPVRYLTYPLDYWGTYYGPIAQDPAAALAAGVSFLKDCPREWDTLELRWVGVHDGERRVAEAALSDCGYAPVASLVDETAVIDLRGSWDEYLASRSSKLRSNLSRSQRRLDEMGTVRFEHYRASEAGADARWDLFDDCLTVAQRSWQGSSTTGTTISHSQVRDFIRDSHAAAADCGCVDIHLAYLNHGPVAFAYNYVYRGYVFGLRMGRDPSLSRVGVGNLLKSRAIQWTFERGGWRYDLGPGTLAAKQRFQTRVMPIYRLSCFDSCSPRQQLLRWKRQRDARNLMQIDLPEGDLGGSPVSMP